jgi:acyl-CoA oxidase
VLEGLARRLRRAGTGEEDPFTTFNNAQDHVLHAARAHIDRVVLEAFVAAVDRCPDPETSALLDQVCDLYALSVIEADRAWFLEHGRLTAARSKDVSRAVNELCGQLRPHARALVDAFAIPESWLAAPITGAEAGSPP